jgi:hypothetical protein
VDVPAPDVVVVGAVAMLLAAVLVTMRFGRGRRVVHP